jgi:plasmid stability protein
MAKTTVELPEVLHRTLRVKAALENRSMNDIVLAALTGYLHDFRLSPELLDVETVQRTEALEPADQQTPVGGTT